MTGTCSGCGQALGEDWWGEHPLSPTEMGQFCSYKCAYNMVVAALRRSEQKKWNSEKTTGPQESEADSSETIGKYDSGVHYQAVEED